MAPKSLLLEVHQGADGARVSLRPLPIWSKVWTPIQLVVLLLAMAFACLAWAPPLGGIAFSVLVTIAALAAYVAAMALVWHTFGREVVSVSGGHLTIEHVTWRRVRRTTFDATSIVALRAIPAGPVDRPGRTVQGGACLAFDYQGTTIRFGAGLEGAEADRVLAALAGPLDPSVAAGLAPR